MRAIKDSTFLKHNAVFWTASLLVSFLNYLYYPVLGRLLDPVSFGETQTIISFFTQLSAFFLVLGLVGVGVITKYPDKATQRALSDELSRLALGLSILFFVLTVVFSPLLKHFFHFGAAYPFILLGILLLINVPFAFANSYLQGNKRFATFSKVNILVAVSKLELAVLFVLMGLKTLGAIGGLICAQIIGLLYSLQVGRGLRSFVVAHLHIRKPDLALLKPELPFALMVLATSLATNLFISFDILVVKHFFSPAIAGLYTGISIISNIIYYVTGPFAAVMIPSVRPAHSRHENQAVLKKSLIITLGIGGGILAVFLLVPHLIVLLLLGHKYAVYAGFLRGLAVSMFALSLANLLIYYHIGLRHFLVAPTVLVGMITTLSLLARKHSTMNMVVQDLVVGSMVLLGLLAALLLRYRTEGVIKKSA